MYNRVILVGNLTRDVELRYSNTGIAIGKVGIATNRKFKSHTGEMRDETMFIDLTFFGRTAEVANQYLRRGSKVLVEGRLVLEQWVAADGTKRSKHSVTVESMQMLDSRGDNQSMDNSYQRNQMPSQPQMEQKPPQPKHNQDGQNQKIPEIDINEDEIPF
jgi:single-strand DNA-binding protein